MKSILIIDDEKDLCGLIKSILIAGPYEIDCALSLSEGVHKWKSQSPALVLLDNNLPDGVSLDMLEENLFLMEKTEVIMMTADSFISTRKRAEKLCIFNFIQKPFSVVKLRELVKKVI